MERAITYEDCPECGMPEVEIEHVWAIVNDSTKELPYHIYDCPECGESMALVCYDCPVCNGLEHGGG